MSIYERQSNLRTNLVEQGMAQHDGMKQCLLRREFPDGTALNQVSWLPDKFAKTGSVLRLRSTGGEWSDGWKVAEVWSK